MASATTGPKSAVKDNHSLDADLAVFEASLADFATSQRELDSKLQAAVQRMDTAFRGLDDLIKAHKDRLEEHQRLVKMLRQLRTEASASDAQIGRMELAEKQLDETKASLDQLNDTKPKPASVFVRFMLGKVSVKMWKKSEQLLFRDEYNKFKLRTTWIFILWPLLQLFAFSHPLVWTAHQLWLLYYYMSLSLRENILQANGSNIHNWWIYHHYISLLISTVSLLFPADTSLWHREFLLFALLQGVVMLMQNRYQSRRQYVRKSLGKAKDVDVDSPETITEKPTDLKILSPLLFALYAFEMWFGVYLYLLLRSYEVLIMGSLFCLLGVGNAVVTGKVLFRQQTERKKKRTRRANSMSHSSAAAAAAVSHQHQHQHSHPHSDKSA